MRNMASTLSFEWQSRAGTAGHDRPERLLQKIVFMAVLVS
jgi:hypothetical protein